MAKLFLNKYFDRACWPNSHIPTSPIALVLIWRSTKRPWGGRFVGRNGIPTVRIANPTYAAGYSCGYVERLRRSRTIPPRPAAASTSTIPAYTLTSHPPIRALEYADRASFGFKPILGRFYLVLAT